MCTDVDGAAAAAPRPPARSLPETRRPPRKWHSGGQSRGNRHSLHGPVMIPPAPSPPSPTSSPPLATFGQQPAAYTIPALARRFIRRSCSPIPDADAARPKRVRMDISDLDSIIISFFNFIIVVVCDPPPP